LHPYHALAFCLSAATTDLMPSSTTRRSYASLHAAEQSQETVRNSTGISHQITSLADTDAFQSSARAGHVKETMSRY
jgi:hypothetical protein